jgi:hypothetical protein
MSLMRDVPVPTARTIIIQADAGGMAPAAIAGAVAAADGDKPAAAAAGTSDIEVGPEWVIGSVVAVAITWFAVAMAFPARYDSSNVLIAAKVADGFSALALFYVAAQVIERLLEPFTSIVFPTKTARLGLAAAVAKALNSGAEADKKAAADKQNELDRKRAERGILFWAIASIVGMATSAYLGLYFVNALVATGSAIDPRVDVLITGLLIGSGSKPLHDLITNIQVKKDKETDPPETKP